MRTFAIAIACLLVACQASAQQPRAVNARVEARTPQPNLPRATAAIVKDQVEPAWLGYVVPALEGRQNGSRNDGCGAVRLEPAPAVMILFRVQNREVQKIWTLPSDCQIDGGGLALYWFDGVDPSQSVAWLRTFVTDLDLTRRKSQQDAALAAIVLHKDAAAVAALVDLAEHGSTIRVRKQALFWLGQSKDPRALSFFEQVLR
jgi:hypothetical protein